MRKVFYILDKLTDEDVVWLAAAGDRQLYAPGEALIRENEAVDALIFVLDGWVSVTVAGVGEVARLGSGEILGEMSLVDESPPSATVAAVSPTQALVVPRRTLDDRMAADPAFASRLYRAIAMFLSIRMRATVKRLGYGSERPATEEEIDLALLDRIDVSGARFDRMIKTLLGA